MQVRTPQNLILGVSLSFLIPVMVTAKAPLTTHIPEKRPTPPSIEALIKTIESKPKPRPADLSKVIATIERLEGIQTRPTRRPENISLVMARKPKTAAAQCRNKALVGEPIDNIVGKINGCGIKNPVRLTAVSGVQLSRASIMNCETANAFANWTEDVVKKEFKKKRRKVVSMDVLATYSCRRINNQRSGKLSQHAKGNAVDIGSFVLDDGDRVSVFIDWNSGKYKKTMRKIHAGACGPFTTVLGPKADRYHRDHFHMDLYQRRNPYCR
ncbi:MAG: extensin family protein [Pseudomonadota bacterium]